MNELPHPCEKWAEPISMAAAGCLSPDEEREIRGHIETCSDCRERFRQLSELCGVLAELRLPTNSAEMTVVQRVMSAVEQVVLERQQLAPRVRVGVSNNQFLERVKNMILAHKRLSAAAAATVAALAASLILYVSLFSTTGSAYALEQTAEAISRITSYHVKVTPAAELGEAWVQLNPDGTLLRARMDLSSPSDGPKVSIVSPNRAEVWFKAKNSFLITSNQELLDSTIAEIMKMRGLFDPKLAFEQLQAGEKAGKVQVETKEPTKEGEPITLTVTSKGEPDRRQVFEVDPKSKLVKRMIEFRRRGEQWEQGSQVDYLEYNEEFDPKVFQPELPKDIITVDQTKVDLRTIGLAKGDLTDEQIATKVAKECFEALIAGDYQKAGQMLRGGIPGDVLKQVFEQKQTKFLRIVEIGQPTKVHDPRSSVGILGVRLKVEKETEGKRTIEELSLQIRPLDKNSDRWNIYGGF